VDNFDSPSIKSRIKALATNDLKKLKQSMILTRRDIERDVEQASIGTPSPIESETTTFGDLRDNDKMTNPTREEIDAKLDLLSARSDARARETELQAEARLARFEERIDQAVGAMAASRVEYRQDLRDLKSDLVQFKADVKADLSQQESAVKADGKATRVTMWVTAVATVIGIAAFNATVLSNMVASFESGKSTMNSINEATKRLDALQEKLEAQAAAQAAANMPRNSAPK